jgi:hypothetical protein
MAFVDRGASGQLELQSFFDRSDSILTLEISQKIDTLNLRMSHCESFNTYSIFSKTEFSENQQQLAKQRLKLGIVRE